MQSLIDFVRRSHGRVIVRVLGYSPAFLDAKGGDWSDDRLRQFFIGEARNLDSVRRALEADGVVSIFLIDEASLNVQHYHIRQLSGEVQFFRVL